LKHNDFALETLSLLLICSPIFCALWGGLEQLPCNRANR